MWNYFFVAALNAKAPVFTRNIEPRKYHELLPFFSSPHPFPLLSIRWLSAKNTFTLLLNSKFYPTIFHKGFENSLEIIEKYFGEI